MNANAHCWRLVRDAGTSWGELPVAHTSASSSEPPFTPKGVRMSSAMRSWSGNEGGRGHRGKSRRHPGQARRERKREKIGEQADALRLRRRARPSSPRPASKACQECAADKSAIAKAWREANSERVEAFNASRRKPWWAQRR